MWSGTIELIYPSIIGWQHCFERPAKHTALKKMRIVLPEPDRTKQTGNHTHTHTHAYQSKPRETNLAKQKKQEFSCIAIEFTKKKRFAHLSCSPILI